MPQAPTVRNQVFVSYSHADEEYLQRLRVHLGLLERRNIKVWTDKDIEPGMQWQDEIRTALARTKVAVLMISTDFLNSDFITNQELPPLLAAAKSEGAVILPVLVKPSLFGDVEVVPLSCYQAVNMNRPLVKLKDDAEREEEFVRILQVIRKHMEGAPRPSPQAAAAPSHVATPLEAPEEIAGESEGAAEEPVPLDVVLEAMMADPAAQALLVRAVTQDVAIDLMLVTEGQDGTMLLEVLSNDELPPELHLERNAQRHLVEQLGFNRPQIRGDRFWTIFGADGGDINPVEITEVIAAVLEGIFGLPTDEVGVDWVVLEQ
jgi:hypothetical protein